MVRNKTIVGANRMTVATFLPEANTPETWYNYACYEWKWTPKYLESGSRKV